MRKWLVGLFLLLIMSFSVVGFVNASHTDGIKVEQEIPAENEPENELHLNQ